MEKFDFSSWQHGAGKAKCYHNQSSLSDAYMIQNPERVDASFTEESILLVNISSVGLSVMPLVAFSISFSWFISSVTCESGCFCSLGRKLFIQPSPWVQDCTNTTFLQQPNLTVCRRLCYFGPFSISYTCYICLK